MLARLLIFRSYSKNVAAATAASSAGEAPTKGGRDASNPSSSGAASAGKDKGKAPNRLRLNMAERVLMERHVESVSQISHTAEERVIKQMSTRTMHKILPLSIKDTSTDEVRLLARQVLLRQRARAAASFTDKNGVPILTPINGIGHFVLSLQRVLFTYCSHAKDSDGMRDFLSSNLSTLAEAHPGVEFVVEPRWGHLPLIRGFFLRGHQKVLCVKNMMPLQIIEAFLKLRNSSGQALQPFHQKVRSSAPAIRPIWSPFHMLNEGKNDPLSLYRSGSRKK